MKQIERRRAEPAGDPVVTYTRVDGGRASRFDERVEPRVGAFAAEPHAPSFDDGAFDDRFDDNVEPPAPPVFSERRRSWGLRAAVVIGAIAVIAGVGLLVTSFSLATVGGGSVEDQASLASAEIDDTDMTGSAAEGGAGVVRNISAVSDDAAVDSSLGDSSAAPDFSVAEPAVMTPPPAPRVRPDPATVAPTAVATTSDPAALDAAPAEAGTDGLIANIERVLGDQPPAAAVDAPAMDAVPSGDLADAPAMDAVGPGDFADGPAMHDLPPGDFEDAPAMDAWPEDGLDPSVAALPQPGTATTGTMAPAPGAPTNITPPPSQGLATAEPYGPPSPYPSTGSVAGAPGTLQPGQLYIPPMPGAPVPPADIPGGAGSSTGTF